MTHTIAKNFSLASLENNEDKDGFEEESTSVSATTQKEAYEECNRRQRRQQAIKTVLVLSYLDS